MRSKPAVNSAIFNFSDITAAFAPGADYLLPRIPCWHQAESGHKQKLVKTI